MKPAMGAERQILRDGAIRAMQEVFAEIPYGISHTLRVLANADEIQAAEMLDDPGPVVIDLAAVLHDIGAAQALRLHGSSESHLQEAYGPAVARTILEDLGVEAGVVERVVYIVGHHHTQSSIDGTDFQILWEADALDGLEFGQKDRDENAIRQSIAENFRTETGTRLALRRLITEQPKGEKNTETTSRQR